MSSISSGSTSISVVARIARYRSSILDAGVVSGAAGAVVVCDISKPRRVRFLVSLGAPHSLRAAVFEPAQQYARIPGVRFGKGPHRLTPERREISRQLRQG